jgi:hypothetical protein
MRMGAVGICEVQSALCRQVAGGWVVGVGFVIQPVCAAGSRDRGEPVNIRLGLRAVQQIYDGKCGPSE